MLCYLMTTKINSENEYKLRRFELSFKLECNEAGYRYVLGRLKKMLIEDTNWALFDITIGGITDD